MAAVGVGAGFRIYTDGEDVWCLVPYGTPQARPAPARPGMVPHAGTGGPRTTGEEYDPVVSEWPLDLCSSQFKGLVMSADT
ncbi:hypothetical protein Q8A67_024201 [Cirrhinus molitorella]|uniref:Uncharacterized protein n=1 Tax=Cirrhinus molitorella TaxID=172907 RepID=A0AA88TD97_9TELE|nr:hypothetical protein Q8A67_024201 [Cirrhinus molitorella]